MKILRTYAHEIVTIVVDTAYSDPPIDMREFSALQVHIPAAWTDAALGFSVGPVKDSTYGPLYTTRCSTVGLAVLCQVGSVSVSEVYHAPEEVGGAGWVRLWSQVAGADENQVTTNRVIRITKKS